MNTIVLIPAIGKVHSPVSGAMLPADEGRRLALLIQPGSLHASGEIYQFFNGNLFDISWDLSHEVDAGTVAPDMDIAKLVYEKLGREADLSDILLPRYLQDELHRLARANTLVYLIRTPGIGLGSTEVEMTLDQVPILVPPHIALERQRGQQEQKHVSKPNSIKRRGR